MSKKLSNILCLLFKVNPRTLQFPVRVIFQGISIHGNNKKESPSMEF